MSRTPPGRKPVRTPEELAAASADRVKATRERRKAAGLRIDGTARRPLPRRTPEEKKAAAKERYRRREEKKRGA